MTKEPKWAVRFYEKVYNNWTHHAPCEHVNMRTEWNTENKAWHIYAAPVYQELYGGEDDGKRVWAGFVFDIGDFGKEEGVWIQEHACFSACKGCSESPKMMIKGKFRGHNFLLHVSLEPVQDSEAVEVIDTLKKEIRAKIVEE